MLTIVDALLRVRVFGAEPWPEQMRCEPDITDKQSWH